MKLVVSEIRERKGGENFGPEQRPCSSRPRYPINDLRKEEGKEKRKKKGGKSGKLRPTPRAGAHEAGLAPPTLDQRAQKKGEKERKKGGKPEVEPMDLAGTFLRSTITCHATTMRSETRKGRRKKWWQGHMPYQGAQLFLLKQVS